MKLIYKIDAKSEDEAVEKAMKAYDFDIKNVLEIKETLKSSSFFGFFKKDGKYEIKVDKDQKSENKILKNSIDSSLENMVKKNAIDLLEKMGLNLDLTVLETKTHYILLNLSGKDNSIIIGKRGKTLNNFEYLLNSMCKDIKVEVDVDGFKVKRVQSLITLAKKMAEKALTSNEAIKLVPMIPKERRIIHEEVNKYKELETFSEGKEPKRNLVIKRKIAE